MYISLSRAFRALCIPVALLGLVQVSAGQAQMRFAGAYELTNVVEDGSQVHFTLQLTLLNPGNTDVKSGIVVLMNSQPNSVLIGQVATIKTLTHLSQTSVSQNLTVAASEYARWQQGHDPILEFLVPVGSGTDTVRIQARRIVPPGQVKN
jgi:hypothetical protein